MNGRIRTPGIILAGLEACWLYTLLDLLHAATGATPLPRIVLPVFFALAFAFWGWLPWPRGGRLLREAVGGLLLAAILAGWAVLSSVTPEGSGAWTTPLPADLLRPALILPAVSGGVLWFMGRRAGRLQPDFALFLGEFQFGLAMLVIVYSLDAHFGTIRGALVPPAVLFFVVGLAGLSLARDAGQASSTPGRRRRWRLGLLAGSLALVLALALWILAVIRPGLLAWTLAAAAEVGRFAVWILARFLDFLAWLLPPPDTGPIRIAATPAIAPRGDPQEMANLFQLSEAARRVGQFIVSAGWVGIFLVALWRVSTDVLRWFRKRMGFSNGTEAESLEGAFGEDLRRIAGALWARLRSLIRYFTRGRQGRGLAPGVEGVRQAYRRLLEMGAAGGCPKKPAWTPGEHLESLAAWLPEAQSEMAFITGRYVRARYGPGPVAEGTVEELTPRLRTVRRLLRKRRKHSFPRRV